MKTTIPVVWTCGLVISILAEFCSPQKLNVHWGPQSMMYLKGKCEYQHKADVGVSITAFLSTRPPPDDGKRFVLEDDSGVLKQSLRSFLDLLRGIQGLTSADVRKSNIFSLDKVLVRFLQRR